MGRHLGLIIGINQYQDTTFRALQCAENDARALAQWFVNAKGGQWSPPDVQLVHGQHATRELIEALITQICINKAERDDIVVLYFAGHAFMDEKSGEGYLALTNTQYQDTTTALSLTSFTQQVMLQSQAAQIVCILDCFQTGQIWSMRRTSPYDTKPLLGQNILQTLQSRPNHLFLCSCRGNELGAETAERGLGLFAHRMILGLCGPAADSTGNITLSRLHGYLFSVLEAQQRPQLFGLQQPPLILVGTLPALPSIEQPAPDTLGAAVPTTPPTPSSSGGGLLRQANNLYATATAPVPPQTAEPFTSGHLLTSALDQHREQQCQQLLAQAQQLLQAQNFVGAFNTIEQVLQIAPQYSKALTFKAQLLGTAGRFSEALSVVDQLGQINPNNPLAWSMRAVLLSNTGQHETALSSIERSIELDPQNPESYVIKNNITANIALAQSKSNGQPPNRSIGTEKQARGAASFLLGAGIQFLGLVLGAIGVALIIFSPHVSVSIGLALISLGVVILCAFAARNAFRYGITQVLVTLLISLAAGGTLGASYVLGYKRILVQLQTHTSLLVPLLLFIAWAAVIAVIPLILAIIGFISGLIVRALRRAT